MNTSSLSRNIWGISILVVGLGLLLDALNVIEFSNILGTWWPLLVIVGGIGVLVNEPRRYLFPLWIIAIGVLFQLDKLDVVDINAGALLWPALIIMLGLSLVLRPNYKKPAITGDDKTDMFAALAGIDTKVTSQNYIGGNATAILGGVALDLRQANIKDVAQLDLFTFWGGIEIKVPNTWHVNVSGTPLMGGWENKADKPTGKKAPVLNISATCIMGGVEIKN